MNHDTSFDVIKLLDDIGSYLFGITSVGPENLKDQAGELINRIDETIGR